MLRRLLPESISIDLIPGHNLPSVSADPGQLEQVIVNLCVNARDAMERGGQLTIETENVEFPPPSTSAAPFVETNAWALDRWPARRAMVETRERIEKRLKFVIGIAFKGL